MSDCNNFIVIFYDFKIQSNYLYGLLIDNYLIPTFGNFTFLMRVPNYK